MKDPGHLEVVLRFRVALERMQAAKLRKVLLARADSREQLRRAEAVKEEFQQQRMSELEQGVEASALQAFSAAAIEAEIHRRAFDCDRIETQVRRETEDYLACRRSREAVEKLVEKRYEELEKERDRKQQMVHDEATLQRRRRTAVPRQDMKTL